MNFGGRVGVRIDRIYMDVDRASREVPGTGSWSMVNDASSKDMTSGRYHIFVQGTKLYFTGVICGESERSLLALFAMSKYFTLT